MLWLGWVLLKSCVGNNPCVAVLGMRWVLMEVVRSSAPRWGLMLTTNVLKLNSPSPSSGLLFAQRMRQQQEGSHQMQFLKPGRPAYEVIRFCSLQISVALCISSTEQTKVQEFTSAHRLGDAALASSLKFVPALGCHTHLTGLCNLVK